MKKIVTMASAVLSLLAGQAGAAPQYSFTDLAPSAGFAIASAINNKGQIAGMYQDYAAVWNGSAISTLPLGYNMRQPGNISETGYVPAEPGYAVIWKGGNNVVALQGDGSVAAVNSAGIAVGEAAYQGSWWPNPVPYRYDAVVWSADGAKTVLPSLAGAASRDSRANYINDSGVIVGSSAYNNAGNTQAVTWNNGVISTLSWVNANAVDSWARAISANGQIVGTTNFILPSGDKQYRATTWINGTATDLGLVQGASASFANGVNARGQVVGQMRVINDMGLLDSAMLWDNGVLIDLNQYLDPALKAKGYHLNAAYGINDDGTIVGVMNTEWGGPGAFKLTLNTSPVPEPQTWAMLLLGVAGIAVAQRKTRKT